MAALSERQLPGQSARTSIDDVFVPSRTAAAIKAGKASALRIAGAME